MSFLKKKTSYLNVILGYAISVYNSGLLLFTFPHGMFYLYLMSEQLSTFLVLSFK